MDTLLGMLFVCGWRSVSVSCENQGKWGKLPHTIASSLCRLGSQCGVQVYSAGELSHEFAHNLLS